MWSLPTGRKGAMAASLVLALVSLPAPVPVSAASALLHAKRVINPGLGPWHGPRVLPLTGPGARDSVHLTRVRGGQRLALEAPSGTVLLSLPAITALAVVEFGAEHPPVLVVKAAADRCGNGGCTLTSYTYDATKGRLVVVPAAPATGVGSGPAYRYVAVHHAFKAQTSPAPQGLFGFARLLPDGHIRLFDQTYDVADHVAIQDWQYVAAPAGPGRWTAAGPPTFVPSGPLTGEFGRGGLLGPGTAAPREWLAELFLDAIVLHLPKQAATFARSLGVVHRVSARVLTLLASDVVPGVGRATWRGGTGTFDVYEMIGPASLSSRLLDFQAEVTLLRQDGRWRWVKSLSLRPVRERYATVRQVLALVARDRAAQAVLTRYPRLTAVVGTSGPGLWRVTLGFGRYNFLVNEQTGVVQVQLEPALPVD